MKSSITRFAILVLFLGWVPAVSAAEGTLHKNPGVDSCPVSGSRRPAIRMPGMRGVGAAPWAAPGQAAGAARPQPLTSQQLLELVNARLSNQRLAELVKARGIDFQVDDDYARTLRRAGANEQLITLLREAGKNTTAVALGTAPNAQVYLDGNFQGQADGRGELEFRATVGAHTLKVSLAGKQDFEQTLTFVAGPPTRVIAPLADLGGSVRVKAPTGAAVWLDDSIRGTVDSSGEMLLGGVPPGVHLLRITAPGKVDDVRHLVVAIGAETPLEAVLADPLQENPQDGLKYVWIAAGNFMMGCSPGDNDCADSEKPAHQVTLRKAYWIGQTEVTVAAYKRFARAAKMRLPDAVPKLYHGWSNGSVPMVDVTWGEASQYCSWVGGRLPTEAEWEYAARGGSPQARYGDLDAIAWFKGNAASRTHEVAAKLPNGSGLYDTLGNVWEWVNDWFDPNYYQSGAAQDPTGPATGIERVLRGGAWIFDPKVLRVSDRYNYKPDTRSDFFGFRCVWEPKNP